MRWDNFELAHWVSGNGRESIFCYSYIDEVSKPHVIPFVEDKGTEFSLQQVNARPHVARIVQNFFNIHNIVVMDWPTRTPDLNLI